MQVLNCKQHCAVELASHTGRDKPFEDFLPSHFNYLQFSYYNSEFLITKSSTWVQRQWKTSCLMSCICSPGEKYEQAIECAKTFLLFHPDDEVMNQNLAYYSAVLGEEKAQTISARQVRTLSVQLLFIPQVKEKGKKNSLHKRMYSRIKKKAQ